MPKPNLASLVQADDAAPSSPDMDEEGPVDPQTQAASLIREAVQDGDDESLADALKSFFTLCSAKAEPESAGRKGKPSLSSSFGKG